MQSLHAPAELPAHAAASEPHGVLLYQDERYLVRAMGTWAEHGLAAGESVVLVVRGTVATGVRAWLRENGLEPQAQETVGRLRILDADGTLSRFMVRGMPQANLFANSIAPLIEDAKKASPGGEVRLWGEMVDLLWRRAQGPAALALEDLWSGLIAQVGFRRFCAYHIDAFDVLQFPKVRAIAENHGIVLPAEDEELLARSIEQALDDTYGPEADAVRNVLGARAEANLPVSFQRLLALEQLVPEFAAVVAARAGAAYRTGSHA